MSHRMPVSSRATPNAVHEPQGPDGHSNVSAMVSVLSSASAAGISAPIAVAPAFADKDELYQVLFSSYYYIPLIHRTDLSFFPRSSIGVY